MKNDLDLFSGKVIKNIDINDFGDYKIVCDDESFVIIYLTHNEKISHRAKYACWACGQINGHSKDCATYLYD